MTPPLARGINPNNPGCHPNDGVRPQPGLDTPLKVYEPDYSSWFKGGLFGCNTTSSSSGGNFLSSFTNRLLFGENRFGWKTSFGLVDLAVTWGVSKLFGGNSTYTRYTGGSSLYSSYSWGSSSYGDTFSFGNSKCTAYTGAGSNSISSTAKAKTDKSDNNTVITKTQYEALLKKDKSDLSATEKSQKDAYEKQNKLGKYAPAKKPAEPAKTPITEADYTNAKTPAASAFTNLVKAGAAGVIRNTKANTLDVSNDEGVANVSIYDATPGDKNYPTAIMIKDKSNNEYVLTEPRVAGDGTLTYKVDLTNTNLHKDDNGTNLGHEINTAYTSTQANNRLVVKVSDGKIIVENNSGVAIATA